MAQPGNYTPILLYGSSTPTNVPLAANLTNSATGSEIAINVADKNLFFKDSGGTVNTVPIRQSSTSSNGWLSSTDWNTFNNKAPATSGTSILYGNGTGGFSNVTIGSGISFAGGTLSATGTGGTVTSVAALTLGTTGTDLSSTVANGTTTPVITLNVPTASAANRGALSAADWSTFNGKQAALVSGTNIKTVGGVTLLGSGDVGTIGVGYGGTGQTSFTAGQVHFGSFSTDANFFWDNTNKRLGLGTSAIQSTLTIEGGITPVNIHASTTASTTTEIRIGSYAPTGATGASIKAHSNYGSAAATEMSFWTSSAEAVRISGTGGVSIGNTTDPGAGNLFIQSGGTTSGTAALYCVDSSATPLFKVRSDGAIQMGTAAQSPYNLTTANVANLYIDSNGTVFRSISSLKYKTNVQDAIHGLADVLKLRPVTYQGKADKDGDTIFGGLIAEEVDAIGLKEFVQYAEDGTPDALAYGSMVSLLAKAIQQLNDKFEAYAASHP